MSGGASGQIKPPRQAIPGTTRSCLSRRSARQAAVCARGIDRQSPDATITAGIGLPRGADCPRPLPNTCRSSASRKRLRSSSQCLLQASPDRGDRRSTRSYLSTSWRKDPLPRSCRGRDGPTGPPARSPRCRFDARFQPVPATFVVPGNPCDSSFVLPATATREPDLRQTVLLVQIVFISEKSDTQVADLVEDVMKRVLDDRSRQRDRACSRRSFRRRRGRACYFRRGYGQSSKSRPQRFETAVRVEAVVGLVADSPIAKRPPSAPAAPSAG